jgi:hypothetical protein
MHGSLSLYDRWSDSELVKLVFPFDSPATIFPLVLITTVLVFYAVLLIKLKPSMEEPEITEDEVVKPENIVEPMVQTVENVEGENEDLPLAIEEKPLEAIKIEPGQDSVDAEEIKQGDERESRKTFFLFGERQFDGCPHKFGYLKSLRKNAPIPDECFGCPQILECLMTRKSK